MKRIFFLLAVALSAGISGRAAMRPHFGGTLRIETRGSISSFDTRSNLNAADALIRDIVLDSVCDRLVTIDPSGRPVASLATSWRSERDGRSWFLTLRNGVLLHNGNALSQQMMIASLAAGNPNWRVRAEDGEVLIQSDTPLTNLLYELAEPRNSICLAGSGQWIGSGPFQIGNFQAGQRLELNAFEESWQGRPFLDRIQIDMAKSLSDQAVDLQLGRADVIEAAIPEAPSNGQRKMTEPAELIALVFAPNHPASSDQRLRGALALAVDRNSILTVLLRRQGEADASLLPEWISGYAHLFEPPQDLLNARRLVSHVAGLAPLALGYDADDPLAKLIAERIAVNAREAGVSLLPVAQSNARSSNPDASIVRVRIESPNPGAALVSLGSALRLASLQKAQAEESAESLYSIENDALKDYSVIPIAQVPEGFSVATTVHDWKMTRWGEVNWGNVWLEAPK